VRSATEVLNTQPSPDQREYLVEGLVGLRQIFILCGDSGHGKSPFAYQGSLSVTANKPFMGLQVRQAAALYLDFEDSLADSELYIRPMLAGLGLSAPPPLWRVWHALEAPPTVDVVKVVQDWLECPEHAEMPKLLVIDPYEEWPDASIKNEEVRRVFGTFRRWQRQFRLTVWLNHHINKEPTHVADRAAMPALRDNPRRWLERSRGGKNLMNASDGRAGFEEQGEDRVLVAGFRRARGKIGPFDIARQLDEDGEPLYYRRLNSAELLDDEEARLYGKLPQEFRTLDVKGLGVGHNQTCDRLLKHWQEQAIIRRVRKGVYQKCGSQENV
jgi:hypothetical protein